MRAAEVDGDGDVMIRRAVQLNLPVGRIVGAVGALRVWIIASEPQQTRHILDVLRSGETSRPERSFFCATGTASPALVATDLIVIRDHASLCNEFQVFAPLNK